MSRSSQKPRHTTTLTASTPQWLHRMRSVCDGNDRAACRLLTTRALSGILCLLISATLGLPIASANAPAAQAVPRDREGHHDTSSVPAGSPMSRGTAPQDEMRTADTLHSVPSASSRDDLEMLPVAPYVADAAVLTGPVSARQLAQMLAWEQLVSERSDSEGGLGGDRQLLMKKGRRRRFFFWAECNKCTVTSCPRKGSGLCHGKCRKRRRLINCATASRDPKTCSRNAPFDPEKLAANDLELPSVVTVMANAPFIPCANISGLPSGCPGRGTPFKPRRRGSPPPGRVLMTSTCVQHKPQISDCVSPFYPFGFCMCTFRRSGRGGSRELQIPCSTAELDMLRARDTEEQFWGRSRVGFLLADLGVLTEVDDVSGRTYTRFGEYADESQPATFTYNAAFEDTGSTPGPAEVSLDYYRQVAILATIFNATGEVFPDYVESPEDIAFAEAVDDAYFEETTLTGIAKCYFQCYREGGAVLGSIGGDYYSVHYEQFQSCPQCEGLPESETEEARYTVIIPEEEAEEPDNANYQGDHQDYRDYSLDYYTSH
eukprot:jgi/Ulvmu1/10711/UM067_0037.1